MAIAVEAAARTTRWTAERRFHLGFGVALVAAVLFGFARTFFLRPWFPEWAEAHSPREPFFLLHGAVFTAWLVLLLTQLSLVAARRVEWHRRLGWVGAGLALAMIVVGTMGALIAARRPTGFVDVPVPPLRFLLIALFDLPLFAAFVTLGVLARRRPQSHKRYLLLASISIIGAGVARWPLAILSATSPLPGFGVADLIVDLFLVPMVVWDLATRRRLHPVTLWGGLAIVVSQPLRLVLSGTDAWLAIAGWAIGAIGPPGG